MAARGALSVKTLNISCGFNRALKSALFEWLLIFMLFINAVFSYLLTIFAHYCELQSPCLLCSRLDHFFGNEKLKYYLDLICANHKLEISSLVFCHAHNKLVDVHGMCESCLFSFATINKSNAETYRLLVGKLGENSGSSFNEEPLLEDDNPVHSSTRKCSCCNQPWVSRGYARNLLWSKSGVSEAAEPDIHLQGGVGHGEYEIQLPTRTTHQENIESHPLSHIAYRELKVNSETGSEAYSEDETIAPIREADNQTEDHAVQWIQLEHGIISLSDIAATEKLIDPAFAPQPSGFVSEEESEVIKHHNGASLESKVAVGDGLEELNWQPSNCKTNTSVLAELNPLPELIPTLSSDLKTPVDVSNDSKLIPNGDAFPSSNTNESFLEVSKASKILPLDDMPSSSNAHEDPLEVEVPEQAKIVSFDDTVPSLDAAESPVEGLKESFTEPAVTESENICQARSRLVPTEAAPEINLSTGDLSRFVTTEAAPKLNPSTSDLSRFVTIEAAPEINPSTGDLSRLVTTEAAPEINPSTGDLSRLVTTEAAPEINPSTGDLSRLVTTEADPELNSSTGELSVQVGDTLDLSDAYKIAVGNKGKQQSDLLAEQWTSRDSSRLTEDLKALLSQLSARGIEQSLNDISPKLSVSGDDLRTPDASSSNGIQLLQRRTSLERNESNLSLDGSLVSEIEGESEVDRLKRQVEHDRKLLSALYKELEEERSASTVAVNQAMAMITRLQEEKAILQMDALQNIRMMEEQAEYDMEALQKTNDLLAEKEKEIQDLEAAFEFYRQKFSNEAISENVMDATSSSRAVEKEVDNPEGNCAKESMGEITNSVTEKPTIFDKLEGTDTSVRDMDKGALKNSLLGFEDETLYILESLKKIEKKLHLFSNNGIYSDLGNGECSEHEGDLEHNRNRFSMENNIPEQGEKSHASLLEDYSGENLPVECKGTDLSSLENEISDLNEKLETLKADQNFLEHAINSLRDEEEGLKFIREIASHLEALRRIGIR
ncbi:myosin-binding protein 1-like isoform X2 [Carica papaya]|uniref:myosin-binding protein 1-like isoform X2 n=1 Tax=Carica papaya TaxID=3649 RepID=UPI000B8CF7F7|nr:myosin-binding protein 1-like isoform X2 [Carica papaya]